jgi:phage shock protein PspC (stress-responsive transcriptional regulator)
MNEKQLTRTRDGRMIAGVCSGAGAYFGIDPNIIRLVLGISLIFGGAGALIYGIAWLLVPEEGKPTSILQDLLNKQQSKTS